MPPNNSRMFYAALLKHGVSAQYVELSSGGHGLTDYKDPSRDEWQDKSLKWLASQKFILEGGVSAPTH